MEAINITAFTENNAQVESISAFIKSMNIKFTMGKSAKVEKPYNPEFVAKIKASELDLKEGRFTTVKKVDLNNYIDSL
jgi:D-Tyr-tRNAtyr deacylase